MLKKFRKNHSANWTFVIGLIVGFLLLLFVDLFLIRMESNNYEEKWNIIAVLTGQKGEVSYTAGILKGTVEYDEAAEQGIQELQEYGYKQKQSDILWKTMRQNCSQIIVISVLIYIAFCIGLFAQRHFLKKEQEQQLEQLSYSLDQLAKNLYESEEFHGNQIQNPVMQKVYEQIHSISDVMRLDHARVNEEKEGTKSLVTDISHQLKTPVAALKTCFDVLKQQDLSEEERNEFTARCERQLEGLEELLKALLSISRLEAGMIEIKEEPCILFETVATAVSRVYPAAERKQISIEMEAEEELQNMVLLHDRNWISEALINLLDNALKYSPSGSTIHIRMQKRVSFLRIEIEDDGIGIPKSEYHKVFQRFYRGQSQEVRSQTGSGVGLYLTRQIVERHHGSISVTSSYEENKKTSHGSIFAIQLPSLTKM